MNTKSTVILALAIVVSILGASLLMANSLGNLQMGSQQLVPAGTAPVVTGNSQEAKVAETLTINSNGSVKVAPDRATLNLSFSKTGSSVKEINTELTQMLAATIEEIKAYGIDAADIQTSGINIYSDYNYSSMMSSGFRGDTSVTINVRKLEDISQLIDLASKKDGYSSCYFNFEVEDRTEPYKQAIDLAVAEANLKAETLAKSVGRSVGMVLSIEEYEGYSSPLRYASMAVDSAAGIVEGGSISVNASLKVIFQLGE